MANSDSGIRLLIAEDDDDDFFVFSLALQEIGVEVNLDRAENGRALLHFLEKDVPDILLIDILMPLKDGRECLKDIRSNNRFDSLPVIMYTSLNDSNSIDYCFNQRCNLYAVKPNTVPELATILTHILHIDWKKSLYYPERSAFVLQAISKNE